MSKEMREQIDRVKNWKPFVNEDTLKQVNVTDDILPYIENAFYRLKKEYGDKYDFEGYTFNAFEFDEYHEHCPYGFDMDVDIENKRVHMEICSQNDGFNMGGFGETIYDELEGVFLGTGGRKPFVEKTEYDVPIKI